MSSCLVNFTNELVEVSINYPVLGGIFGVAFVLGLLKLVLLFLSYVALISDCFLLPGTSWKKYGANKGAWALITGASDGIGKEYAYQLASRGFNVALVSRTASKLEALKEEIVAKYNVDSKILAFDASTDAASNYAALETFVDNTNNITVLVNNVGISHSIPTPFLETEDSELRQIINVNNIATLKFTQIVVPKIVKSVANKVASRGLVLTMGSFAGLTPTPLLATYSGSKAFLQAWNNALARELEPQGVDCQMAISYLVTSAMSKVRKTSAMIPSPKDFVKATLANAGRRAGAQERYATATPYWSHALLHWFIENTLGVWSRMVMNINYNMHVSIRKRALRKAARQAEQENKQK